MTLQSPDDNVKRTYRSPRRQEQARATRDAILEAALALFMDKGFQDTTVKDIAERAAVSEQTVYNAFGDKIGLLHAAGMRYMESGGGPDEAAFLDTLTGEADPLERLRIVARESRRTWESGALEMEIMVLGNEPRDPRLDDLEAKSLAYKHTSTRQVCEILFPDAIRRPGLDLDDITGFATALDSAVVVKTLLDLGWTMDRWESWLVELMVLFLDPRVAEGS